MDNKIKEYDHSKQLSNKLNKVLAELKPHQKIEISFNGDIHIIWRDSNNKKHSFKTDNLYENVAPDFAINGKSWVVINTPALKSYRKFGNDSREKMDGDILLLCAIFEFQCDMGNFKEYSQLDNNSHTWQIKETKDYKGYYLNGKLAKLQDKNNSKQYFVRYPKEKLKTEKVDPLLIK